MTGLAALRGLEPTPQVFVAATGAGAGIQASLWSIPGASTFLAGAAFPYSAHETERFLGFRPARFCDELTAVELALAAYLRGRETALAGASCTPSIGPAPVVGLGLTASVASLQAHRGDHRVFVATIGQCGATAWSARLAKGTGEAQRAVDGRLADQLGVHALLAGLGLASDESAPGVDVSRRELPQSELRAVLFRRPVFGPGESRGERPHTTTSDLVLFPGTFDPCHEGHQMIADAVERQYGRCVAYTITADPVHKPTLRAVELLDRVASIRLGGGRHSVVLTERDPLFIDKARQFPGAGLALGVDALIRMLDPSWGPNVGEMLETFRAIGTRFYVVGRVVNGRWTTIDDVPIPHGFRHLFESVEGRHDVSSTQLRGRHELEAARTARRHD